MPGGNQTVSQQLLLDNFGREYSAADLKIAGNASAS